MAVVFSIGNHQVAAKSCWNDYHVKIEKINKYMVGSASLVVAVVKHDG